MFATVDAVRAAPPTIGLVASADRGPDGQRWETGMAWVPERCGIGYQLLPYCSDDGPDPHTPDRAGAVYYRPPGVRFAVECSTMGGGVDAEYMRRVADASTPYVIARELWSGELAEAYTPPGGPEQTNPYLASADADVVGAAGSPLVALGDLEAAALDAGQGQRVMLHLPVSLSPVLGDWVRRVGNDWLTRNDSLVVLDAGYPGTGPAGAAGVWAYATSLVQVRMSPLAPVPDAPGTVTDTAANTVTRWVDRVFAAVFDPCVHFAAEITRST